MPRKARIDALGAVHPIIIRVALGMAMLDLVRKFDLTPPVVSYVVERGEKMAKEEGCQPET